MKKLLLVLSLFLLVGCTNEENIDLVEKDNNEEITENLKNPTLEWCQLYNPNGFDTVTCIVSNPNKVDIDITYDLVFYKDGKEVKRNEDYANFNISNKHKDVIWANTFVPSSKDADEVKMENIKVSPSYNKALDADINYIETIDDSAYFSIKHKEKPTLSNIWFFLYNDDNKNNKCDKGELVVTSTDSTMEKEDKISFDVSGYNYTNYEIFYNSYAQ